MESDGATPNARPCVLPWLAVIALELPFTRLVDCDVPSALELPWDWLVVSELDWVTAPDDPYDSTTDWVTACPTVLACESVSA
jgi:hypothetical protein